MIDIHNEIFTKLKNELKSQFENICVQSPYQTTDVALPCVTFAELDNTINIETVDSLGEYHSIISFEINIYTFGETKQSDSRKIRQVVDNVMNGFYGMNRNVSQTIENLEDTSIYRYVMRYTCLVEKNGKIYRR